MSVPSQNPLGFLRVYRWARRARFPRKEALFIARNRDKIEKVEMTDESGRVHGRGNL